MKILICENCRTKTYDGFKVNEELVTILIKSRKVTYIKKSIKCKICNSELYDENLNDINLKSLQKEYSKD